MAGLVSSGASLMAVRVEPFPVVPVAAMLPERTTLQADGVDFLENYDRIIILTHLDEISIVWHRIQRKAVWVKRAERAFQAATVCLCAGVAIASVSWPVLALVGLCVITALVIYFWIL